MSDTEDRVDVYLDGQGFATVPRTSLGAVQEAGGRVVTPEDAGLFRSTSPGRVVVFSEDNRRATIPREELSNARKAGFRVAAFDEAISFLREKANPASERSPEDQYRAQALGLEPVPTGGMGDLRVANEALPPVGAPGMGDLRTAQPEPLYPQRYSFFPSEELSEDELQYRQRLKDAGASTPPEILAAAQGATRYLGGDFIREGLNQLESKAQRIGRLPESEATYVGPDPANIFMDKSTVAETKDRNPVSAGIGEIAGVAAGIVLTSPASIPTLIEAGALGTGAKVAAKTGSKLLGKGAALAAEGAAYTALNKVDEAFLRDDYDDLTVKSMAGAAALGAATNIAGGALMRGLKRAYGTVVRRTPPKSSAPTPKAPTTEPPTPEVSYPARPLEEVQTAAPKPYIDEHGQVLFGTFKPEDYAKVQGSQDAKRALIGWRKLREGKAQVDPDELEAHRGDIFRRAYKNLTDIAALSDDIENRAGIRAKKSYARANYAESMAPSDELVPVSPLGGVPENVNSMPFRSGTGAVNKLLRDVGLDSEFLDGLLQNKSAIDEGGAAAVGRLKRKIEGTIENVFAEVDEPEFGVVHSVLDQIKRDAGKIAKSAKNQFVKEVMRERNERLKELLQSPELWPQKLATDQAAINARWHKHLNAKMHELLSRLWVQGSEDAIDTYERLDVPNPATVDGFLRNVGKAEYEPLEAALYDYLHTMREDQLLRAQTWGDEELVEKVMQLHGAVDKFNYNVALAKAWNTVKTDPETSEGLFRQLFGSAFKAGLVGGAGAVGGPALAGATAAALTLRNQVKSKPPKSIAPKSLEPTYEQAREAATRVERAAEGLFSRLGRSILNAPEDAPKASKPLDSPPVRVKTAEELQELINDLFSDDEDAGPQSRLDDAAETDPAMIEKTAALINAQRAFISEKASTAGKTPDQRKKLLESIHTTIDPLAALDRVSAGESTPETLEALKTVWSPLWTEYTQMVAEKAEGLSYDEKIRISRLIDVPLDPSMEPARMAQLQALAKSQVGSQMTPGNQRPPNKLAGLVQS